MYSPTNERQSQGGLKFSMQISPLLNSLSLKWDGNKIKIKYKTCSKNICMANIKILQQTAVCKENC